VKDPEEKLVSAETMQKGIKNIIRVIEMHKNNQLDYLTVCGLVRKIFRAFDFDCDGILDKKESKALLDAFTQEMALAEEADAPDQQSLICCQNELVGINNPVPLSRGIAVRVPISRGFVVGIHSSALRRSRWVA